MGSYTMPWQHSEPSPLRRVKVCRRVSQYFMCYCGHTGVERIANKSLQKVHPGGKNDSAAPAADRTCGLLITFLALYQPRSYIPYFHLQLCCVTWNERWFSFTGLGVRRQLSIVCWVCALLCFPFLFFFFFFFFILWFFFSCFRETELFCFCVLVPWPNDRQILEAMSVLCA